MTSSDETTFHMLKKWEEHVVVRRGGRTAAVAVLDETAEQFDKELTDLQAVQSEAILLQPHSDPELVAAARAYLLGEPTSLGAAAATLVRIPDLHHQVRAQIPRLLDAWIGRHGLLFAVQAVADLARLRLDQSGSVPALRRWPPGEPDAYWDERCRIVRRMRVLLTVADDADYREAVGIIAQCRSGLWLRLIAAYLVPDQTEWVDELCAEVRAGDESSGVWDLLLCTISTPSQLDLIAGANLWSFTWNRCLPTLTDALGPEIAPFVAGLLDRNCSMDERAPALEVLAAVPSDEAFDLLLARISQRGVRPAVLKAMERYPLRATRLLARAAGGDEPVTDLLTRHLRARPEVLSADLPEDVRKVAESMLAADERISEALPELLVRPPRTLPRPRKPAAVIINDLPAPAPPQILWQEGERARWAREGEQGWVALCQEAKGQAAWNTEAEKPWYQHAAEVLEHGPEEEVLPLLVEWFQKWRYPVLACGKRAVARFGLDARQLALDIVSAEPEYGFLLAPFVDAEIADVMADWLVHRKSARMDAMAWLLRHGRAAVPLLLVAALGRPGPARTNAEAALRFLSANGHDVGAAAAQYGAAARSAIDSVLAVDRIEALPAQNPTPGAWLSEFPLPALLLRDRVTPMPGWAIDNLISMLMTSRPGNPFAGLETIGEACDPRSLAEFGWELFERWRAAGTPPKDGWVLTALAWLGDDDTVRRLSAVIRAWPGEGGHARAAAGLDVLAVIGTDVALSHLQGISQKAKFKGLRSRAQDKIAEIALLRRLSPEQLADRMVPDFGLGAHEALVLDYGPRRFMVGFDEFLKPFVTDGSGKRLKSLPKPGAKDDPEAAPAAYERFAGLKKDVRVVAADQIPRLEQAMVARRRWSAQEFTELFARHPLLSHIVRRLVWVIDEGTGTPAGFRLAEDLTLADIGDEELSLSPDASVGIAHPLHLGEHLSAWADLFADYEILQPFPQLGRPVFTLDETGFDRFAGLTVPTGKILGMERRGWERESPRHGGWQCSVSKALPGDLTATIHLDSGIHVGSALGIEPEQRLGSITLEAGITGSSPSEVSALDPVTASELIAELVALTSDQ